MANSYERNDREKSWVLRRFRKTVRVGADETSDGRLFQRRHPATGNARSPIVGSPVRRITAAWMTTTGDGGGWNQRQAGCGRKDTVAPDHAGIGRRAQPA